MTMPADLQARFIATVAAIAAEEVTALRLPPAAAGRLQALLTALGEAAEVLGAELSPGRAAAVTAPPRFSMVAPEPAPVADVVELRTWRRPS